MPVCVAHQLAVEVAQVTWGGNRAARQLRFGKPTYCGSNPYSAELRMVCSILNTRKNQGRGHV